MRIHCKHCGGKARIGSRQNITDTISNLYCQCLDVEQCGHTFVMTLSFSHSINLPNNRQQQLVLDLIRNLPEHERQELIAQAQAAA